jgi:hypothetical protein
LVSLGFKCLIIEYRVEGLFDIFGIMKGGLFIIIKLEEPLLTRRDDFAQGIY